MNQSFKRTAMNSSLSAPAISSTTATSSVTFSMIMKYELDNGTEDTMINQNVSMRDYSEERLFQAVYLGYLWTALIIGLPGNVIIAVVYVVIRQKRTSDWFIFFLSVYDCAVCVFAVPLYLSIETGAWMDSGSDLACKLEQFTIFTAQFSSVCMLGTIAVDRYLKICHPTKRSLNATQARNLGLCTPLVSAIVAAPILVWDGNVERRYCQIQEQYKGTLGVKMHLCFTFGFFVCVFFVVIFCYSHVCYVVRRRIRRHRENALKRKHLMQIPAFLQAISNVDDPHGLSGHHGSRNKKRFSLFSIGSSRRLSAISPWIKARLSLPSDGCGRKLANPEDEEELATKESLVDIKRQLDYALMFRAKSSTIEESYGDRKEFFSQQSREYNDNVDEINRHDVIENLQPFTGTSNDTCEIFNDQENNCNGLRDRMQINDCNNISEDSVFENHDGSQVNYLADTQTDQGCEARAERLTLSNLDLHSSCHTQEGDVVLKQNQTGAITNEAPSRTNADEHGLTGDSGSIETSLYTTARGMSQNIKEGNITNCNSKIQTTPGTMIDADHTEGSTVSSGDNDSDLNTVYDGTPSKKSGKTVCSECCRCRNECSQTSHICDNSSTELAGCDFPNVCRAKNVQERLVSCGLSQSLRSLFARSRKSNSKQSPSKAKGRSKRCRSASCLVSPKHVTKLSRTSVSRHGENMTQSYSDLSVIQPDLTKPEMQWKHCIHKTLNRSTAFDEFPRYKNCCCQRLHFKHNKQARDAEDACVKSPCTGYPGHLAVSQKTSVHQNMVSTLVRELNYTNLPYIKLVNDVSEASCQGKPSHDLRPVGYEPTKNIHILIGCDDDDYVDDDGTKALLDNPERNRFAAHNRPRLTESNDMADFSIDNRHTLTEFSDMADFSIDNRHTLTGFSDMADCSIENSVETYPIEELVTKDDVRRNKEHQSQELDDYEDYLSSINDRASKHDPDNLKAPLLVSDNRRKVQFNKKQLEKMRYSDQKCSHADIRDCHRAPHTVSKAVDITHDHTHMEHPHSRRCDTFTYVNHVTSGQKLINDDVDVNSVSAESSNNRSLGDKPFVISRNPSQEAACSKIYGFAENSPGGLFTAGGQNKQPHCKKNCVLPRSDLHVCDTVSECCSISPHEALDSILQLSARSKEYGSTERVNTYLAPSITHDNCCLTRYTYSLNKLETNVPRNNKGCGSSNSNHNTDLSQSEGLPSVLQSEPGNPTLSLGGSGDNHLLFKDTTSFVTDEQTLDIVEEATSIKSTKHKDCALREWDSHSDASSTLTEKQYDLLSPSVKLQWQDPNIGCSCGQMHMHGRQMNVDKTVSANIVDGSKDAIFKLDPYNTPIESVAPVQINIHEKNHLHSCDSTRTEIRRSQSPTQEGNADSRNETNAVNFNNPLLECGELNARKHSPDKLRKHTLSSDTCGYPDNLSSLNCYRCSTCSTLEEEPNSECGYCSTCLTLEEEPNSECGYVQLGWTSNKCGRKEDEQFSREQNKLQHDNVTDTSEGENMVKNPVNCIRPDLSCLCVSPEHLQPLTHASSNKCPCVMKEHLFWSEAVTSDSSWQTLATYLAADSSSTPGQPEEYSPSNKSIITHSRDISKSSCAIADKASEFDFSQCDECLVVKCIDFLPEKNISLAERIIAVMLRTKLANSTDRNFRPVSCIAQPNHACCATTTSPNPYIFDIITSTSLHLLTNRFPWFRRHCLIWDIFTQLHFNLSPLKTSLKDFQMESAYNLLHNNHKFVNDNPQQSVIIELNPTVESPVDTKTSLKDPVDVSSGMTDCSIFWKSSNNKMTPIFICASVYHYDDFCHCKYFWSRFVKEIFNNEICPFCLKPMDFSGFAVFLHSRPRSVPLNYPDNGTFEKWLCRPELDTLGQKSMWEGECPILVYGAGAQNGCNCIFCCRCLEVVLQNNDSSGLVFKRDTFSNLGEEGHQRLDTLELSIPVGNGGVSCENASTSCNKEVDRNDSHNVENNQSLSKGNSCTNPPGNKTNTETSHSTASSVVPRITSDSNIDDVASTLLLTDTDNTNVVSSIESPDRKKTPYGVNINGKPIDNESEATDVNQEETSSRYKQKWLCNVPNLQDYIPETQEVNVTESTQCQESMKTVETVLEASVSECSSLPQSKLTSESFLLHPNDRMRQFKLSSSNIVNCALNSLVPLAVGSSKQEPDIDTINNANVQEQRIVPDNHSDVVNTSSTLNHTSSTKQDIEVSRSSNTSSENEDNNTVLPVATKTIHSALLGCVPTFQIDDFELKSSLEDVKAPQSETCQFFVRTVFDTFFTSNSYPFKSDPCLTASNIDYENSDLLVFPLSPLFARNAHHKKETNEECKDTSVFHIADRKRQRLNSAFDIYDARVRKIRSPKRNGAAHSWFSLNDLSAKPTSSRHASMVFLASLRRQLNNVLSPKSIRQFFGIHNPPDNKSSIRKPPSTRDTLSANQINVIITRCDSLIMDTRQEMGLPPIRDRAATLDPASLDKVTRVSHESALSNMGTNHAFENKPKPRTSSLDTSYSSNSHSDDPSLLCRSQDLSMDRSRMASLDLLSPASASFRSGSMCSGISSVSKLTECSAYTEHSRSDCEKITRRTAEREHNITKLLGVITLVFVISWSVSWSVILIDTLTVLPVTTMLPTNVTLSIARNLFLVNHFCNILVYMVLSRSFRDKMSECYKNCTSCCTV